MGIGVSLAIMISSIRPHCCQAVEEYNPYYEETDDENLDDDNDEDERDIAGVLNIPRKAVTNKKQR